MTISNNRLEHVNISVSNLEQTAKQLCTIFDWQTRWQGDALDNGITAHVGNAELGTTYLALYTPPKLNANKVHHHTTAANLNHIAILVDDLELIRKRVIKLGLTPFNERKYEPGERFYFEIDSDIEFEVVSYN